MSSTPYITKTYPRSYSTMYSHTEGCAIPVPASRRFSNHMQFLVASREKMRILDFCAVPWLKTSSIYDGNPLFGGFGTGDDGDPSPYLPPCNIFGVRFLRALSTFGQFAVLAALPLFRLFPVLHNLGYIKYVQLVVGTGYKRVRRC